MVNLTLTILYSYIFLVSSEVGFIFKYRDSLTTYPATLTLRQGIWNKSQILTKAYSVWYCHYGMNDVQTKIAGLETKGWTLAAIADELGVTVNAVEKWKHGDRSPANSKAVLAMLDEIIKRKRIPKKRRYLKHQTDL